MFPFVRTNPFAGIPLTIKSVTWTVGGSIGSLASIMKSVGSRTINPQIGLVTVQALAVIGRSTSTRETTAIINIVVRISLRI